MRNIASALVQFQSLVPDIPKNANNPYFKSKYAPLETILPAIKPSLDACGLAVTQIPVGMNRLKTIIIHADSGETIEGECEMTPAKNDPQGQGSVLTYMRRYALVAMLCLNTDEDDDGNAAAEKADEMRKATGWPSSAPKSFTDRSPDPEADKQALNELM